MAFIYQRRIHFRDTDAAGVMYFANALSICHEAYEESLMQWGLNLKDFFSTGDVAVPITHASIDYRQPSYCGDVQWVYVHPTPVSESEFEVVYQLYGDQSKAILLSQAKTRHVCIDRRDRRRMPLSDSMLQWMNWCQSDPLTKF